MEETDTTAAPPAIASGEKAKARDIIAAIRTLQQIEREHRPATADERQHTRPLRRLRGRGPVALSRSGHRPLQGRRLAGPRRGAEIPAHARGIRLGQTHHLQRLLHLAHRHRGHAPGARPPRRARRRHRAGAGLRHRQFHEPTPRRACGSSASSWIRISGRIARALHPGHDIRIENFRDTKLPEGSLDAVIGNPPFADVRLDYRGQKLPLHDFFIAKSLDALKPGGILALVTSHYTLDKQNAAAREYLAEQADFLGAIRLPSDAFKREGTARRHRHRVPAQACRRRAGPTTPIPDWLATGPLDDRRRRGPGQPLFPEPSRAWCWAPGAARTALRRRTATASPATATWPRSSTPPSGGCPRLPGRRSPRPNGRTRRPAFIPPPPERHIAEGSFFVGDDRIIHQVEGGQGVPVTYGGTAAQSRRHHDRQAARRPGRPARPRPPRPPVAERRLAGGAPQRRPPRPEPGLRPASSPPTARSTRRPSPRPPTARSSAACPTSSNSARTRTPCWSWPWKTTTR